MIPITQKRGKKFRKGKYHAQPATDLPSSGSTLSTRAIQYHGHWLHVVTCIEINYNEIKFKIPCLGHTGYIPSAPKKYPWLVVSILGSTHIENFIIT